MVHHKNKSYYSDNESSSDECSDTENSENEAEKIQKKKININKMTKINKNLKKGDICNIIFEKINDEYSYGKYGPFVVIMMTDTGYINATKLCQLDENKRFRNWKANKLTQTLIT